MNTTNTIKQIEIHATERELQGRRNARRYRHSGQVPAIVYGASANPLQILISAHDALTLLRQDELVLVNLTVTTKDGKNKRTFTCIVKEIQTHPVTDEVIHVDFQSIEPKRKVRVKVPVRLTGTSRGEMRGGRVIQKIRLLEIEVLPEHLKPFLEVDISPLDINQSLRVEDIHIEGGRILHHPRLPVATVVMPRRRAQQEEQQ